MFSGRPSVSACFRACVLLARYLTNQTNGQFTVHLRWQMNCSGFEGRESRPSIPKRFICHLMTREDKVTVTTRSNTWVSYCEGPETSMSMFGRPSIIEFRKRPSLSNFRYTLATSRILNVRNDSCRMPIFVKVNVKAEYSSSWESISELRGVASITCHMGSHSVTCHPTQVNAPRHNPSHPGRYTRFTYPEGMEGWVDLGSPTGNRTHDRLIASPTP